MKQVAGAVLGVFFLLCGMLLYPVISPDSFMEWAVLLAGSPSCGVMAVEVWIRAELL